MSTQQGYRVDEEKNANRVTPGYGADEKRQVVPLDEKYYAGDAKNADARRLALQAADEERRATYFRVVFGFFFFLFFNLLSVANLVNDLSQLFKAQSAAEVEIESKYPRLVPSAKALLALNVVLLCAFIGLVFATLKMPKTSFNIVAIVTAVLQIGKVGSEIAFLGGNANVSSDFREYIREVGNSDIDMCAGETAPYCQAVYTWSFSFYETIIDIIFGSVLAGVMLYYSNREKVEILARSVRVLPVDEKELGKVVAPLEAKSLGGHQTFQARETPQYPNNRPTPQIQSDVSPEKRAIVSRGGVAASGGGEDVEGVGGVAPADSSFNNSNIYASRLGAGAINYNDQSINDSKLYFNPHDNSGLKNPHEESYKNK